MANLTELRSLSKGTTPLSTSNSMLSIHASQINIGTNTFKHEDGNNNFAHRNQPLGYPKGNDIRERRSDLIGFIKINLF